MHSKKEPHVGEELADVAIYLMGLAEILGINLKEEIKRKIEVNKKREYELKNGKMVKKES